MLLYLSYVFFAYVNHNEFILLATKETNFPIYMVIKFFKFLTTMSKGTKCKSLLKTISIAAVIFPHYNMPL